MSQTQTEAPVTTTVRLEPRLEFRPLHETFGAECRGVDFSKPVPSDVMGVIREQLGKYGVLVFRNTGLSDEQYIKLADEFGELADSPPVRRFDGPRGLGDPSNIYLDGSIVVHGDLKWFMAKETALFHVDTSYDARRVRYTSIIARELPPPGHGGATEFSDTRAAYADLDDETKRLIDEKVGNHSHFHSRRVALPDFPTFAALDPTDYPMHKHKLVVNHRGSDRKALYIASHLHHIDDIPEPESTELIKKLRKHVEQDKYIMKLHYEQPGDVVIWDNTAVLHRAGGGTWAGKYRRDIRKWMTFDNTPEEWGLNERGTPKHLAGPIIQAKHDEIYGADGKVYDFDED